MARQPQKTNKDLTEGQAKKTLGVAGPNYKTGNLYADEFIPELKGRSAIKTLRQMRDNDATIGAVMFAFEQVLRDVDNKIKPSESDTEGEYSKFVEEVFDDMDHTLDDHISEALSFLTYGFHWSEVVFKRRSGPTQKSKKKKSKFSDERIGIRKIATRAPWTIDRFKPDDEGDILGVYQNVGINFGTGGKYLPKSKCLHYKMHTLNNDPAGRSVLRNAYTSWYRLKELQHIESVGIERELNGIPHARVPADYLSPDATDDQVAFVNNVRDILRDTRSGQEAFFITPSDPYTDSDGKPTNMRLVDIELMASQGSRNIDVGPVISRYQHDIARSCISEFIMLGSTGGGSYAMSKSKTDLFLRSLESINQTLVDVLNKQLLPMLWDLNGFDYDYMPTIQSGSVAPHDLKELGSYLRNLNGADFNLSDQIPILNALLDNAELPNVDVELYQQAQDHKRMIEDKRYTSDGVENSGANTSEQEEEPVDPEAEEDA